MQFLCRYLTFHSLNFFVKIKVENELLPFQRLDAYFNCLTMNLRKDQTTTKIIAPKD